MRKRVLVVDDDQGILESLQLALKDRFDILTASSGAEAISTLKTYVIDIVVLDYCLPDGFGTNALHRIKSGWPSLPVIVTTAYGSENLCAQFFKLGARDYFSKPYDVDTLQTTVGKLLAVPKDGVRKNVLQTLPATDEGSWPSRHLHPGLQRALLWIHAHYAEPVSLRKVAREAAMSTFHFCRIFKVVVGLGFWRYLTRLRLEKAKERLRDSHDSVADIAFAVGFSTLSSFYEAFRRATGQSPSAWRRSVQCKAPQGINANFPK